MKTMSFLQVVLSLLIAVAAIASVIVYFLRGDITAIVMIVSSVVMILVFAMCKSLIKEYKEVDR